MDFLRRRPKPAPTFDDLVAALDAGRDVRSIAGPIFEGAAHLDAIERRAVQGRIDEILRRGEPERYWPLAILAGAIVETGGDPADLPTVIYDRIAAWFEAAAAVPVPEPDSDGELTLFPEAFYRFEQAAMAALGRSAELRRSLPQKAAIQANVRHYEQRYGFTNKMLSVLDDETIVVVHPSTRRAWACRVGGIADNFELHTLLLHAFAGSGDERIAGEPPSAAAIAALTSAHPGGDLTVTSTWQLASWTGLDHDRTIIANPNVGSWIWNEGYPAEIEEYEGARVVLVDPSAITRSWNAGRTFDGMIPSLRIESQLPDAGSLIDEMAQRASAARGAAASDDE